MEKTRIAIAVPNRSLILTVLNNTLIVDLSLMSEVREYAMILQTIMLTNVLNNNDSYVCSSILFYMILV